jgi:hypothetical protein
MKKALERIDIRFSKDDLILNQLVEKKVAIDSSEEIIMAISVDGTISNLNVTAAICYELIKKNVVNDFQIKFCDFFSVDENEYKSAIESVKKSLMEKGLL